MQHEWPNVKVFVFNRVNYKIFVTDNQHYFFTAFPMQKLKIVNLKFNVLFVDITLFSMLN